jgi:hypothetical protein
MKRITRPGLTGIPAQLQLDRHFAGERLNVFARSVLGGLHHEYSLAPGERDGSADAVSTEGKWYIDIACYWHEMVGTKPAKLPQAFCR